MTSDTKIKYTFHNEHGETAEMIFTILQVEGMHGGFINYVREELEEAGFGEIVGIYRTLLMNVK